MNILLNFMISIYLVKYPCNEGINITSIKIENKAWLYIINWHDLSLYGFVNPVVLQMS